MNAADHRVVERRLEIMDRELEVILQLTPKFPTIASDQIYKRAFIHAVQTLLSAVVDLSQHLVGEHGKSVPDTYYDAIDQLGEIGILDKEFAHRFAAAAKLRNVLVHGYVDLDLDRLIKIIPQLVDDAGVFKQSVLKFLDRN